MDPTSVNGVVSIPLSGRAFAVEVGPAADQGRTFRLRQFIAGPENRLAAAAVAGLLTACVTQGPVSSDVVRYTPLVLYGSPGSGKSHLALGLAQEWSRRRPHDHVVCLAAGEFAGQYADAVGTRSLDAWRQEVRGAALFVLDDLGQIAAKPAAQFELTSALDALVEAGGVVVVTLRQAPSDTKGLLPRLASRLSAGLQVPLAPPGPLARLAILQGLASERGLDLAESAARVLADSLVGSARELSGALAYLEAASAAEGVRPDSHLARQYVAGQRAAWKPSLRGIAARTARYFAFEVTQLKSPSRQRGIVMARDIAMYLARQSTGKSLAQIGSFFGGRDHTTVLYACRKTERLLGTDPDTRHAVLELRQALASS